MSKLVVVSGATKGIGRAIVEEFVRHGFDAAVCARNTNELMRMKQELVQQYPALQLHVFQADVSDSHQVRQFAAFVTSLRRPVDVLVNNAGYFEPGEISTEAEGTLENMMNANLFSAYHLTRALMPDMKTRRAGHIFNMCSIASIKAYANGGSYAITKFALMGFSKCLREETKPYNIRVTALMPGATRTGSWDGVDLPDERFMPVEDVASMVYASYALSSRSVVEEVLLRPQLGDI